MHGWGIKMKNKSAKDISFEKERCTLKKQIRDLESSVKEKNMEIKSLLATISEQEKQIRELGDWNERLLEYAEMTKEDMQAIMSKDKEISLAAKRMNDTCSMLDSIGRNIFW